MTPEKLNDLARGFYAARWTLDHRRTVTFIAETAIYRIPGDPQRSPFAGEVHGRDAIMGAIESIDARFRLDDPEMVRTTAQDRTIAVEWTCTLVHRQSGRSVHAEFVTVFTFNDNGQMVGCVEYVESASVGWCLGDPATGAVASTPVAGG
jgi:ketosteroid isomerase-like protein